MAMDPIEEVYRTDHDRLWRSLLAYTGDSELAAEAEAETFTQAFARGRELYDPQAWIWRTSFRVAAGLLAERGSSPQPDQSIVDQPHLDSSLVDFLDLLGSLSEQQREVVVLRYAGGFTPTEIAELLDTTPGSVRVQLHRAHQRLREGIDRP